MNIEHAEAQFIDLMRQNGISESEPSASALFKLMFDLFEHFRADDALPMNADDFGDALLFQYGSYESAKHPESNHFHIDLTRQFIRLENPGEPDDGFGETTIFQLECALSYELSDTLRLIGDANRWCASIDELPVFKDHVFAHPALAAIAGLRPAELCISLREV